MEIELTKAEKKAIATIYKTYLNRIRDGESPSAASYFSPDRFAALLSPIRHELNGLTQIKLLKSDIVGGVILTREAVIFMENRTADTIKEWLSFVLEILP